MRSSLFWKCAGVVCWLAFAVLLAAQPAERPKKGQGGKKPGAGAAEVTFPPRLPGGKEVVTDTAEEFLKPPAALKDVAVARAVPTVDFLYFPGQTYAGRPWSAWGDSLAAGGKYYASIGDHLAPEGNAFVY